jgi:hypothetical protein
LEAKRMHRSAVAFETACRRLEGDTGFANIQSRVGQNRRVQT